MTRQYLRKVSLVVADDLKSIDLSPLHIKFQIRQWDLQTPNTVQVRVYNVSESTANQVQREFSTMVLQAGYEDGGLGTIFSGTLVQVRRGRESAADTYLDLSGADGDPELNFSVVSTALAAGSSFKDRVDVLTKALGVPQGYVPTLPDEALPRGRTLFGMAKDHLRDISAGSDCRWSVQLGQFVMVPLTASIPGDVIELNSATGLIGFPEQTQDGIQVKVLLNPQITIGRNVRINNKDILQAQLNLSVSGANQNAFLPSIADDGLYRVIVAEHSGDTRGQEYYTDLICVDASGPTTPGLVQRGYS